MIIPLIFAALFAAAVAVPPEPASANVVGQLPPASPVSAVVGEIPPPPARGQIEGVLPPTGPASVVTGQVPPPPPGYYLVPSQERQGRFFGYPGMGFGMGYGYGAGLGFYG